MAQAEYVVDLFQDLKTKDTPLRNVTNLCETICRDIKPQQKKQLIRKIMKFKQESAYRELEKTKRKYTKIINDNKQLMCNNNIYKKTIEIIREEKNKQRRRFRNKRVKKVKHLESINRERIITNKQRTEQQETRDIEGITVGNQEIPNNYKTEVRKYGNVKISPEQEEVLKLPPKLCVYEQVSMLECATQVKKSLVKMRWQSKDYQKRNNGESNTQELDITCQTKKNKNKGTNENPFADELENEEERETLPIDRINKTIDLSILRPSDIPNKSVSLPPPLVPEKELKLQQVKQELLETTKKYIQETDQKHKTNKTSTYEENLTKQQIKGMKSLKDDDKIIIFTTDKTGAFSADTPENYKEAS